MERREDVIGSTFALPKIGRPVASTGGESRHPRGLRARFLQENPFLFMSHDAWNRGFSRMQRRGTTSPRPLVPPRDVQPTARRVREE